MGLSLEEIVDGFSCYVSGLDECRMVYKEIYQDHCYDIAKLSEKAFIIDAGANIGLFSLYMKEKYPQSKIIAFEPAPESYEALERNLKLHHAQGIVTYQYGLGFEASVAKITYFPKSPANSTFHPQSKNLVKRLLTEDLGHEFTDRFFGNESEIPVPIERLSHFLSMHHSDVSVIDFLKIDVEGAELEVILGLDDLHWAMLRNIAIETGNGNGELAEIERILKLKGFEITTTCTDPGTKDERYKDLWLYLIVGRRRDDDKPETKLES